MRPLEERPSAIVDPLTRALRAGSFRGGVPRVGALDKRPLQKGPLFRLTHEKRWVYAAVTAGDVLVGAAVVRFGYASNCFAFVFDRAAEGGGRITAKYSAVAAAFAADVGDTGGEGCHARFRWPGASVAIERGLGEHDYRLEVRAPDLRVSARLSAVDMAPPIGAVAALPGPPDGLFNATEKGMLLPVVGEVVAAGRHHDLDGGLGGYDFTSGYMARHTAWRWGFALGRARSAERVGLNLVQGFVGEGECAAWVDGELFPLSEGLFDFDVSRPLSEWTVRTAGGEVDLRFEPGDLHAESHNFGLVASRFIQPAGSFSGTIRLPGRAPLELDRVLGVVEDQDVLW